MKKYMVLCAGLCAALVFNSCGTNKESAYKKAYEKAKAQEQQSTAPQTEAPVVTPLVEKPATQTTVDNYDNVVARSENVTVIDGAGLKSYSVVVGSFSLKANAMGLQSTLKSAGYAAQIAFNSDRNMYRVVASTFDSKGDAARSRDSFRSTYPDAWLLFKK